jgi:hypothetical protein
MRDIPIIFSGPMVRALLDGRKTMTRRLAWGKRYRRRNGEEGGLLPSSWQFVMPGDRLWVRENWALKDCGRRVGVDAATWPQGFPVDRAQYIATDTAPSTNTDGSPYWWNQRPCIHMPRWASRLTLVVTSTKDETLQAITELDAMLEGVEPAVAGHRGDGEPIKTYRTGFCRLWNQLHGESAWLDNPQVVALTFTVHKQNIDAMREAV